MMFNIYFLLFLLNISLIHSCPLKTVDSQSGCYCGIEIDGTNYIQCRPYSIETIPEFTRSYVYDTLNLSFNFIRTLTNQSWNQLKVKRIYLQQNLIDSIDRHAFEHPLLNYLEELHLDMLNNGSLEFLCYGHWSKLRFLELNGFNFQLYQSCLGRLHRLEKFIILNSSMNQLSYHIYQLPHLTDLSLIYNQLEYLHFDQDLLISTSSIQRLNLTYNQLRTIPNDLFERLPQLIILDLSHNLIEHLPMLHQSRSLNVNLSHNFIHNVQFNIDVHRYDLSSNPICTVERRHPNIDLRLSTQLNCDCRLAYFLHPNLTDLTVEIGDDQPFGSYTKCSTPMSLRGSLLKDLTYEQLWSNCDKILPDQCREVKDFYQIETFHRQHFQTTTTTTTLSTSTSVRDNDLTTMNQSKAFQISDLSTVTKRTSLPFEYSSFRLTSFTAVYESGDLIVYWDFNTPPVLNNTRRLQFQIIVEQQSSSDHTIIRRSGWISPYLKQYILPNIPSNENYYVCLLITQSSHGTDKYCREIQTINIEISSTSQTNFVLSKQAFVHLLFTNRSIMFGFLVGTILTAGLLLASAFVCHLRSKRDRFQRATSSLFHYQHPPQSPSQQHPQHQQLQQHSTHQHYLYADQQIEDPIYSNSIFSSLSSAKSTHGRKQRRRPYFPSNPSWYHRDFHPLSTVPGTPRCCFHHHHHHHLPETTISSSATARRIATLSSQYSTGMEKEPMTSTSIMSTTSSDETPHPIAHSPTKHVYEELSDETTMLRRNGDFFL